MSDQGNHNPGLVLKAQREKLGLSINDISLATKISPRILRALEEGQRDALPPRSFVRGFIRSYANYLKIDPKPIIDGYELNEASAPTSESTDASVSENEVKPPRTDMAKIERPSSTSNILVVTVIVVLVVLIFGIKKVVDRYAKERVVPSAEQVQNMSGTPLEPEPAEKADDAVDLKDDKEKTDTTATPTPSIAASVSPIPTVSPSPTPMASPSPTVTTKPTPTPTPSPTPKPTSTPSPTPPVVKPSPTPVAKPSPTVTPPVSPTPSPTPKPVAAAGKAQEVIIEALDQVEVTLRIDDGSPEKIKLKPESVHTIKAKKNVSIEVSDGGLVNIIHNGSDRGNPGTLGKPAKVSFP